MTLAVTGLGAVTALGASARESFSRILTGERAFAPVTLFESEGYRSKLVAEVKATLADADAGAADGSRTAALATMAAREALASAGIAPGSGARVGLVLGGSTAGMLETESLLSLLVGPERSVDPETRTLALARMLSHPLSAPGERVDRLVGPFTRVRSLSSACSSGATALVVGAGWLEQDLVDVVLCGAADALCRVTLGGFGALGALDPDGARPFDRRRRGLTLGEGAGFLVLEKAASARARGQRAVCTLLGWSSRAEAHHITNPEPTGRVPAEAMREALMRAGASPADLDYVNAHGTGTPLNDPMETAALEAALGDVAARVPVSSQKGQIGHTLAAAGAIEAVLTALAIESGELPPTGGLEEPDPALRLAHVRARTRASVDVAMSSSFGFGGMDAVVVLGGASREAPARDTGARRVFVQAASAVLPAGVLAGPGLLALTSAPARPAGDEVDLAADALDAERGRRLDRTSRLAAVATEAAGATEGDRRAALVLGSAFGAVDATAAFMRRLREKGPRLLPPAEFPSLVPSSPAGHVSIYHRFTGAGMVVADLAASGEAAFAQAYELARAGEAPRVFACAVEERSLVVEQVLAVLFGESELGAEATHRGEGAAALALVAADAAPGEPVLCEVSRVRSFAPDDADPASILGTPPPGAVVVLAEGAGRARAFVAQSPWSAAPQLYVPSAYGTHEAMGGIALAVAAAIVGAGRAPAALALGIAKRSAHAIVLRKVEDA